MRHTILIVAAQLALCCSAFAQIPGPSTLFAPALRTHTSVNSGRWQDASTWNAGQVPDATSRVWVQPGTRVTIHGGEAANCKWVNVGGKLDCCDHCDIRFNLETAYIAPGGELMLGSAGMPCKGKVIVEFTPGEWGEDRAQWGRGILGMGMFSVAGQPKTEYAVLASDLPVGSTSLTLREAPVGWQPGDELLLAGTDSKVGEQWVVYQSEYLTLQKIDGKQITFTPPVKYRHFPWKPDLQVHVANLTRNVVLRSQDPATIKHRGHVMLMMPGDAHYCELVGLGRTDKSKPVTDPRVGAYGEFVEGSDANPRARYAGIHSHRTGPMERPTRCRGVVVRGSPGLGMVNHNSNCEWDNCIAVECFGAGFFTEEGQERGYMRRCLGAMNNGLGDDKGFESTDADHGSGSDWAKAGDAFWLQGSGVEVSDCVAFDNSGRGFALFNRALNGYPNYGSGNPQPDYLRYEIAHDFSMLSPAHALLLAAAGYQKAPSSTVPLMIFARNTAYGNKVGVQGWMGPTHDGSGRLIWPDGVRGSLTDTTLWGYGAKLHLEYMGRVNVDGLRIVGDNGFRNIHNTINRQAEAVLVRNADVTIRDWDISGVQLKMKEFRVVGANDPGGIAAKNIVIEGATVQADGSVTINQN